MRFHVLAVPHTVTHKSYSACAFTQKVLKFCTMMHDRGHILYHYGHEKSEVQCTEKVNIMNDDILEKTYGKYNWKQQSFKHSIGDLASVHFNTSATIQISKRKQKGDFLLLFWGSGHAPVARAHSDLYCVEPGIGCFNNLTVPFSVFESYAVMHYIYGKYNIMPKFYDSVIPNFFDSNDFYKKFESQEEMNQNNTFKQFQGLQLGYVVVIARLIPTKGISLAAEICKKSNLKLILAGQGQVQDVIPEKLFTDDFPKTDIHEPNGFTHVGYIEPEERAFLLAGAKCLLCPTLYAEPFGGVNVEAQMSGIPVLSTDWGAFSETVEHGKTGFRCRTMDHFLFAIRECSNLDSEYIRNRAIQTWGLTKIGEMYEEYFDMIQCLPKGGFYYENNERKQLTWLAT